MTCGELSATIADKPLLLVDRESYNEGLGRIRPMLQSFCKPTPGLQQFVRFYTQRQMKIDGPRVVHPVTARAVPMIEFELGEPICAFYREQRSLKKSPAVTLVGPQTHRRVDLLLHGALEHFVIMFQPDGLSRLFSVPVCELTDEDFDGHAVLGTSISDVHQRLGECKTFEERVSFIDAFLLRRALSSLSRDAISAAANRILLHGGRLAMSSLADRSGLSSRQFQRRFNQQVGMRPKLFARIARFEAALDGKARFAAISWTDVAQQFGYYDHMHMVHDFGEFTSETPTETLSQLKAVFSGRLLMARSEATSETNDGNTRVFF